MRDLKGVVTDASQARLGKTRRGLRDLATGVDRTSAPGENSKCTKSPESEKANNESTTGTLTGRQLPKRPRGRRPVVIQGNAEKRQPQVGRVG